MKKKIVFFPVIIVLLLGGFFGYRYVMGIAQDEIRISSNPWVGFTPFIYAQEKGWFDRTHFRFVWQVDLTENVRLFERGFTQGFTATQYEMLHAKNPSELVPVFLIDRSDGADVILSNQTVQALAATTGPIMVYLERDSMQSDLFNAFIHEYGLSDRKFVFINSAQKSMTEIKPVKSPMILLSYAPYASQLLDNGFRPIASTKTLKSFSVIDALFVNMRNSCSPRRKSSGLLIPRVLRCSCSCVSRA
jgi:NitT/TauT family transport system substrate-binding protein